jgi:hypothetical protein
MGKRTAVAIKTPSSYERASPFASLQRATGSFLKQATIFQQEKE